MKTIKQTMLGLALSAFSITALAQCPTSVSVTVLSNTSNGNLTVSQLYNTPTNTTTNVYNGYSLYGGNNSYYGNSYSMGGSYTFNNIPAGTYSLCINDSSYCGGIFSNLYDCTTISITNTTVAAPCNVAFTQFTDSNCLTHFVNNTTGSNLTYQWVNMYPYAVLSTAANPVLNLANGGYNIGLYTYSNGQFCDSITHNVTVACGGGTLNPTPCQASFTSQTDSLCNTTLNNTSIGSNLNSFWMVDGNYYSGTNQYLQLSNGTHLVSLYNYSNGAFCDSTTQMVNVACNNGTVTPCSASFTQYTDSNCVTYFTNTSTGSNLTYEWYV